jgi:hypothetical protein
MGLWRDYSVAKSISTFRSAHIVHLNSLSEMRAFDAQERFGEGLICRQGATPTVAAAEV